MNLRFTSTSLLTFTLDFILLMSESLTVISPYPISHKYLAIVLIFKWQTETGKVHFSRGTKLYPAVHHKLTFMARTTSFNYDYVVMFFVNLFLVMDKCFSLGDIWNMSQIIKPIISYFLVFI